MPETTTALLDALRSLNWNHGRGEVQTVTPDPDGRGGTVVCKLQYGTSTARYTLVGRNSVRFRGHQRKM